MRFAFEMSVFRNNISFVTNDVRFVFCLLAALNNMNDNNSHGDNNRSGEQLSSDDVDDSDDKSRIS